MTAAERAVTRNAVRGVLTASADLVEAATGSLLGQDPPPPPAVPTAELTRRRESARQKHGHRDRAISVEPRG